MKKRIKIIVVVAALLVICYGAIMSPEVQIRRISIAESSGVPKQEFLWQMQKLSERYNSNIFAVHGETFFDMAQKEGYNEYLLPSIICIETVGGTRVKGDFNYWNSWNGWFMNFTNFESPEDSVQTFFEILDRYYEGDNLKEFGEKWAPEVEEYAVNVYKIMEQIKKL